MINGGTGTTDAIVREWELTGETTAIDIVPEIPIVGRLVTIHVVVTDGDQGRLERRVVAELTGNPAMPYWIRSLE